MLDNAEDSGAGSPPPSPNDLPAGEAALIYAKLGFFVVPLNSVHEDGTCRCPRGGACKSAGKHPIGRLAPRGYRDASRYGPTIQRWWRICPEANIGIVTGPSGIASLDIDPRNEGDESLKALVAEHGPIPETLHLRTGGGGSQFIFADPERTVKKVTPMPGIDILGGGCLFVAAPSLHRSGGVYGWENWGTSLAQVPPWMVEARP
jgi:hypothetical protein